LARFTGGCVLVSAFSIVSEGAWTITGQVFFVDGGQRGHVMPFDQQGQ
jgi:enoyl-[acyl-carrier-protein] reductase (NADH)